MIWKEGKKRGTLGVCFSLFVVFAWKGVLNAVR